MKLYDNDAYRDEFMALVYNLLQSDGTNDRANQIIDAFDRAPEIEAEPILDNGSLTLDELREMDGVPVWFETIDNDCIYECGWAIVSTEYERIAGNSTYFHFEDFGCVWLAYRHKPEEGTM